MTGNKHDPTTTSQTLMLIEKNLLTSAIRPKFSTHADELDSATLADFSLHYRPRFLADVIWTIDAMRIKKVARDARDPLVHLFQQFAAAKGREIKVASPHTFVTNAFQIAALNAGVKLTCYKDMTSLAESLNKAKPPKP